MHFNEFRTTTTDSGAWTNTKIDDEGGNQVFENGSTNHQCKFQRWIVSIEGARS